MSNADMTAKQMKLEKEAFRRQGHHDIKSKLNMQRCGLCGGAMAGPTGSSVPVEYCGNCQGFLRKDPRHSAFAKRMINLQQMMCPRCKKIITGGVTCRDCTLKVAQVRKKHFTPENIDLVKNFLDRRQGLEEAPPTEFDTSPYQVENRMLKHTPKLTMPKYSAKKQIPLKPKQFNTPLTRPRVI